MKDKKGQGIILGVMLFAFTLIIAILFVEPLSDLVEEQRIAMECSADGKSQGVYLTCIALDAIVPFFIGIIIVVGTVLIIPKTGGG